MKRFFDTELETFRSQLILMGETSIRQVRDAIKALVDADVGLADRVIAADDELDLLEIQIDDEAIRYMNLRAPVATELRLVIVGMKASHDLERVGDEATSIAKRSVRLAAEPPLKPYVDIPRMAESRWRCCAMRWTAFSTGMPTRRCPSVEARCRGRPDQQAALP
jgi:phosphate transport system protein